eukprot:288495_1
MAGINGQLRDQQRHVGQLHLVANQVIGQARRIINDRIGDQMLVISRIYQLQSAVQAHEWHGNARDEMLDYLEHLLRDVAHVEDCKEEENEDSDIANEESKYMESVTVVRTGRTGGQTYDIPRDLLENLIEEGHGATALSRMFNVCRYTVYRIVRDYGLEFNPDKRLSDRDIDEMVAFVQQDYPMVCTNRYVVLF